jgi:hypothetical protein
MAGADPWKVLASLQLAGGLMEKKEEEKKSGADQHVCC